MAKRALICDDDRLFTLWLTRLLKEWGWEVTAVNSIGEAALLVKQNRFELLVLDFFIGNQTASDIIPDVKPLIESKAMTAVLMSAATPEELHEAIDGTCEITVLSKPLDIGKFKALVDEVAAYSEGRPEESRSYLIVDNGGIQAKVLGRMIQDNGGYVIFARDVEQAKILIRNVRPDAVLMECDGHAQQVEELTAAPYLGSMLPPIIVLSPVINQEFVERLLRAGVVDILLKPISVMRLHEALKRAKGEHEEPPAVTGSKNTVMVVEDFTITAKMLERLLSNEGYQVSVMRSAEMALEMIRRVRPDLLLLDLNLPGISGIELLQSLSAAGHTVPTIAVTGDRDPRRARELRKLGVLRVMSKPVIPDELTAFIARYFAENNTGKDQSASYDVLLAMADEAAGVVISAALESEGITAKIVSDGYQAIHELQSRPRAAVIDVVIAGLDGTEVLRRTRAKNHASQSRVLAISEELDNEIAAELKELGADDSLGKPYSLEAMLSKIKALLAHSAPGFTLAEFAEDILPEVERILKLTDDDLFTASKRLGHNLSSTAPLVSLPEVTKLARALEDAAVTHYRETCEKILNEIRSEIDVAHVAQAEK